MFNHKNEASKRIDNDRYVLQFSPIFGRQLSDVNSYEGISFSNKAN